MRNNSDLVNILVPSNLVLEVYAFLAERSQPKLSEVRQDAIKQDGNRPHGTDDWAEEMIKTAYHESGEPVRSILQYLAERPDQIVKAAELINLLSRVRKMSATRNTLAGTLGAFGNRVKSRYKRTDWPFFSWWVDIERQVNYKMGSRTSEIISNLVGLADRAV